MKRLGFDFSKGRIDKSLHPFAAVVLMMLELQQDLMNQILSLF